MKRTSLIITLLVIAFSLNAQSSNNIARVSKVNGIPVYILSQPVNDFRVIFTKNTGAKLSSLVSEGNVNEGVNDKVAQYVTRISREAKRKNLDFDAIMYVRGKKAAAIKFDQESLPETKDLAKVDLINGVHVFVLSEPVNDYDVMQNKNGGLKAASFFTGGYVNRSISGDVGQFVKRIKRSAKDENEQIDAVVYNAGKRAIGIKFN